MRKAAALPLLAVAFAACSTAGSGVIVEEQRFVAEFNCIDVSDGLSVELRVDSTTAGEVIVRFDDNLLDHVRTEVEGQTLFVDAAKSFKVGGAGRSVSVVVSGLTELNVGSGAQVHGEGATVELRVVATGGASVDLQGLVVDRADVSVDGGSAVVITAIGEITGWVGGGSSVRVFGDPLFVDVLSESGALFELMD